MKLLCKANGMKLATFHRYQTAARKACFMGVSMGLATQNCSIAGIKIIKAQGPEAARELRKKKNLRSAASQLAEKATVLPLPQAGDNVTNYIDCVSEILIGHFAMVEEVLGKVALNQLIKLIEIVRTKKGE
jgi:hypothetical protein